MKNFFKHIAGPGQRNRRRQVISKSLESLERRCLPTSVFVNSNSVFVEDLDSSTKNDLTVGWDAETQELVIVDSATSITTDNGGTRINAHEVRIHSTELPIGSDWVILIYVGRGNERVTILEGVPVSSTIVGDEGNDLIRCLDSNRHLIYGVEG